jgi:DHA2 family multidrug resistance protein
MQGSLAASPDQITWVLTSYIVAAAIMTPPVGWLSARYGRRNVFLVSLAGFVIASMLCGAAESMVEMVLFRTLQGVFGASLVPLSQATILDIFPPAQRGQALAIWVMGIIVGPILGPTLGGYLTDFYNWRWVFYINLPLGILTFAGLWIFMKDPRRETVQHFDFIGFAVLSIALGAFQLMLDRGEFKDWFGSTEIIIYAVLCGLGFYLFLIQMLTVDAPVIPPRLFRDVNFVSGLLMIFIVGMLILAIAALLAPYLQALAGRSVVDAGLLLAPRGAGTMVGVIVAGRLANRVDPRWLMLAGILLISATLWEMMGWTPDIDTWSFSRNSMIQGFGLGIVFTPLQVVAFATLPAELRTDGTALFSLLRNLGLAIGVSVTSVVLTQATQVVHSQIAASVTAFNRNLQSGGSYLFWSTASPQGLAALNAEVTRQAAIIGYVDDFKLLFVVSLLMVPLVLMMRRPQQ